MSFYCNHDRVVPADIRGATTRCLDCNAMIQPRMSAHTDPVNHPQHYTSQREARPVSALRVIGIDPGPMLGIVELHFHNGVIVAPAALQCTSGLAVPMLEALLAKNSDTWPRTLVQIERFVVGRGSMKSGRHGAVTRNQVGALKEIAREHCGDWMFERSAAAVKPWATDDRLARAGLLEPTKGMTHARDAARHALFCAVRDGGIPDPLSTRSKTA